MIKIERKDNACGDRIEYTHECFGIAQFNRFSSNHRDFFGAEQLLGDGIRFTISPCVFVETDHGDKYTSDHSTLIDIRMTYNQFAELVSTMNMGEGVPVTITRFNGSSIPYESVNKIKRTLEDEADSLLDKHVKNFDDRMKIIESILEKKNIGVKDRAEIKDQLSTIKSHMKSNIPYYKEEMRIKIQDQCSKAKSEIAQAIHNRMSIKGQIQVLTDQEAFDIQKQLENKIK